MGTPLSIAVQLFKSPRAFDHAASLGAPAANAHAKAGNGTLAEDLGYDPFPRPQTTTVTEYLRQWYAIEDQSPWWMSESGADYWPAIKRWTEITGRAAPPPTVPDGRNSAHRLFSGFIEWMMGLPPGWITACGLGRRAEMTILGNGVVPAQAAYAIDDCLDAITAREASSFRVDGLNNEDKESA